MPLELEHAIGFAGTTDKGLHIHPSGEALIYAQGGCVLISSLSDAHEQQFLRGHDEAVTCLDVSPSGRMIASGQRGYNSGRRRLGLRVARRGLPAAGARRRRVKSVHFTYDERFLLTVGLDKKMLVWDMATGMIVAKTGVLKQTPMCAAWGGRAKNIKGRETTSYQFATGGEGQLTYWTLDPHAGTLTPEECTLGNQVRNFTALAFSYDASYLFAGSSSSDFTAVHVKHKVMHSTTVCGSNGVTALIAQQSPEGDRLIVGCGDGSISVFDGQRNGAQTCRTYQRGPTESCSVGLDGSVSAMQLHACNEETGELRLLAGTDKGTLYAASLSVADHRSIGAARRADARALRVAPRGRRRRRLPARLVGPLCDRVGRRHRARVGREHVPRAEQGGVPGAGDGRAALPRLHRRGPLHRLAGRLAARARRGDGRPAVGDGGLPPRRRDGAQGEQQPQVPGDGRRRGGGARVGDPHARDGRAPQAAHRGGDLPPTLRRRLEGVLRVARPLDLSVGPADRVARARAPAADGRDQRDRHAARPHPARLRRSGEVPRRVGRARDARPLDGAPSTTASRRACTRSRRRGARRARRASLATGGAGDNAVRLWRYADAAIVAKGVGHSAPIRSVAFSPDGKQLVTVGDDCGVLVWNVFAEECFELWSRFTARRRP